MKLLCGSIVLSLVCGAACTSPKYGMQLPKELKRYEESSGMKLISADGVRVKARQIENYPKGDLEFWTEALKVHLDARGYAFKSKNCFKTKKGLDGCTIDFLVPHGPEDWVMSETIFVLDERIILVEAVAPFDRMTKIEKSYATALETFEPES